jgi:hypothetical protein
MISLYEIEIEFIKVLLLGFFCGWHLRKFVYGREKKLQTVLIKNIKYSFMNKTE